MSEYTLKSGILACPQQFGIMRQVTLDNLDPGMERERWRTVYIKENNRETGWPNNISCSGYEILLLLERSSELASDPNSDGAWIVLFQEQTWYIRTSLIRPLVQ